MVGRNSHLVLIYPVNRADILVKNDRIFDPFNFQKGII